MTNTPTTATADPLIRRYREVQAPASVLAGIQQRAQASERRKTWPRLGSAVALGTLVVAGLVATELYRARMAAPTLPTLAQIARQLPTDPDVAMPALGSLRLPERPTLPTKPIQNPSPVTEPGDDAPKTEGADGITAVPSANSQEKKV